MEIIHKLSPQQQAVLDWYDQDTGSLILVARAGCGKSSTLLALTQHIVERNPRVSIFLGAYNKPIADELTGKIKSLGIDWKNAQAKTLHGAGYAAWLKIAPDACKNPDERKCSKILDTLTDAVKFKLEPYRKLVLQAVSLAKQRALGVTHSYEDAAQWFDIIDHFGLDEDLPEDADLNYAVRAAIWLYRASLEACRTTIDFDDMILAPLYFKARFWQYDVVMIDEAQDTNPARRALALRLLKPGGRLVAVGDPAQAIYGFTGADSDAMELIRTAVNAKTLPLNVTYRCPQAVVRRAQRWVPDITAAHTAPIGVERSVLLAGNPSEVPTLLGETLTHEDAILCRNTKPLIELAYTLLRRGVACKVEGREIGVGLINLVQRFNVANSATLIKKLVEWRDAEVAKWVAREKEQKAQDAEDRAETIITLAEQLISDGKTRVADVVEFIDGMFARTPDGQKPKVLTLATVHKSKGREWQRVFILGQSEYMPSKWARKDWQAQQERNLMYVAATRAQREVIDVIVTSEAKAARRAA